MLIFLKLQWNPTKLTQSPMGQKNLAVLTGDHINEGILTRKFTAILYGCEAGFCCTVEPRLTTTPFIRPPRYYGHILSNQK